MAIVSNPQRITTSPMKLRTPLLAMLAAGLTPAASATENGQVRALLGGAAQELSTPQVPGWYGQVWLQHYRARRLRDHEGNNAVATGGGQVLELHAEIEATTLVTRLSFMSERRLFEGRWGASASLPWVRQRQQLSLSGNLPAPQLRTAGQARSGHDIGLGDTEITSFIDWQTDTHRLVASLGVVAPSGDYEQNRTVNTGAGRYWTFRPILAAAYAWENGFEVSTRSAYSFNSRNRASDVRSGQYLHSDFSGLYRLHDKLRLGLQGFVLKQTTDDDGQNVAAHGNRVQALGLGPVLGYTAPDGRWAADAKLLREFGVRNRPEGVIGYLRLMLRLD